MTLTIALVTAADIPAHKKPDEQHLIDTLRTHDFDCEEIVWNDSSINWNRFDLVLIRSTWDYHLVPNDFSNWLDHCQQNSVRLFNPPEIIRWNMHKSYLIELASKGVAVIPTQLLKQGERIEFTNLFTHSEEIIIKPAISATAWHTRRFNQANTAQDQLWLNEQTGQRDMLAQPFLSAVSDEGEYSFMFFDGQYSHAVLKCASAGEFRVQSDFGGTETSYAPTQPEIAETAAMLRTLSDVPLYARVDVARVNGKLLLMELELIEPQLFLRFDTQAAAQLIAALREKLRA